MLRKRLFLILLVLFIVVPAAIASAQTPVSAESKQEEAPIGLREKRDLNPLRTEKVDRAGQKIGEGVDRIGDAAASHLGQWIDTSIFAGISWLKLLFCLFLVLFVVVIERIINWVINKKIQSLPAREGLISWTRIILHAISRPLSLFIWVYGIYAAVSPLFGHFQSPDGTNFVHTVARKASDIGGTAALFWFIYLLVNLLDARLIRWASATESTIDDVLAPLIGKTLRIFIVVIGGILIIQNLTGVKIGPLIASLGIGGLAIALAAKDTIANFFGTLTILYDKPFQIGERIIIDNYDGVIEKVGFRSTRIRLLTGHLVTIPNEKVVNTGLENIAKRPHIRWLTNIGVTYDTPPAKVNKAVQILEEILKNHEGMNLDFPPRVYFNGFNDWSLNIMVIAWYHPPNYWDYQAWLQRTCLQIMQQFEAEGIDFAFPSRTLYMADDKKRQLKLTIDKANSLS
jgi:MscS family membrane protein